MDLSFAWDKDNKHLYVGTSEVYGNGALFKLDLYGKTFQRLYPATEEDLGEILSTEIIALDNESGALDILVMLADETTTRVKVSTK
jgi:CBS-domain-containing membrane protein